MQRVNLDFRKELQSFGRNTDWNDCFHCGNCTATCSLTGENIVFPRKSIRFAQLGLSQQLLTETDPWLCYYCGECSEQCPRTANPGEMMMAFRRWLTSKYDWTGISRLFYKSLPALVTGFVLVLIALLVAGFSFNFKLERMMEFGHRLERYLILGVAFLILLPNIFRMFWFNILKPKISVPFKAYLNNIGDLLTSMFTQNKFLQCDGDRIRYIEHILIVFGYLGLLILTVFFNWFSTGSAIVHWLGYIVGALVSVFTIDFVIRRSRKIRTSSKFSSPSDWLFVIWLFMLGLTAVIVRLLIDLELIENNMWVYFVHLVIIAQWGLLLVPFGKWTHFLYRPFAVYFSNLRQAAIKNM